MTRRYFAMLFPLFVFHSFYGGFSQALLACAAVTPKLIVNNLDDMNIISPSTTPNSTSTHKTNLECSVGFLQSDCLLPGFKNQHARHLRRIFHPYQAAVILPFAWDEFNSQAMVGKTKLGKVDLDNKNYSVKLEFVYHREDIENLTIKKQHHWNELPVQDGPYTWAITKDGIVFGSIVNRMEFGSKHRFLTKQSNDKVFSAGEAYLSTHKRAKTRNIKFNFQSGAFSAPVFERRGLRAIRYREKMKKAVSYLFYVLGKRKHSMVKIQYSTYRLNDEVRLPTLGYVQMLCQNKDFRYRSLFANSKFYSNQNLCHEVLGHVEILNEGGHLNDKALQQEVTVDMFGGIEKGLLRLDPTG